MSEYQAKYREESSYALKQCLFPPVPIIFPIIYPVPIIFPNLFLKSVCANTAHIGLRLIATLVAEYRVFRRFLTK